MTGDRNNEARTLERPLVVVDVGCRWGFADAFTSGAEEVRVYGFDPDQEECERLGERYSGHPGVELVPLALSDRSGTRTLHLTKEPGCSSMYEPDERLTGRYPDLDCARKVGETTVEVTTLDEWAATSGVDRVDHMKIDTQGSELDILRGGRKVLETVRTLEVEVEFNPIYKGQPLFSDVDRFLRERGFVLWKLTNLVHYGLEGEEQTHMGEDRVHNNHVPQTIERLGGQVYWADAHYVRSETASGSYEDLGQAERDVALLRILGHIDLVSRLEGALKGALR